MTSAFTIYPSSSAYPKLGNGYLKESQTSFSAKLFTSLFNLVLFACFSGGSQSFGWPKGINILSSKVLTLSQVYDWKTPKGRCTWPMFIRYLNYLNWLLQLFLHHNEPGYWTKACCWDRNPWINLPLHNSSMCLWNQHQSSQTHMLVGSRLTTEQEQVTYHFPVENHGLRLKGADFHPGCFILYNCSSE